MHMATFHCLSEFIFGFQMDISSALATGNSLLLFLSKYADGGHFLVGCHKSQGYTLLSLVFV